MNDATTPPNIPPEAGPPAVGGIPTEHGATPAPSASAKPRKPRAEKVPGARKPKAEKPPEPEAQLAKSQAFEVVRMNRQELKGAPYNPRVIGDAEKKRLRDGLSRNGLVSTVTFNKRTGNIVGGHQRITQLDSIEGTKNYLLDVAVIDVDESREKEINVLLNNQQAMGQWNFDELGVILRDTNVILAGTGFDAASVHQLFGDSVTGQRDDALDGLADKIREARDRYDSVGKAMAERRGTEHYLVVIFRSDAECTQFLERHKLPDNRYQSGDDLTRLITAAAPPQEPAP